MKIVALIIAVTVHEGVKHIKKRIKGNLLKK